jgi:hypothetical protein
MEGFGIKKTDQRKGPTFHFQKEKMSANSGEWDIVYYSEKKGNY